MKQTQNKNPALRGGGWFDYAWWLRSAARNRGKPGYRADSTGFRVVSYNPGTKRAIRGGSWFSDARDCRSACRFPDVPGDRIGDLGFRVLQVL